MNQFPSLHEVLTTYLEAERLGKAPTPREMLARYPSLAAELQTFFAQQDRSIPTMACTIPAGLVDSPHVSTAVMPRAVGSYEIIDELGRGGMGVVYKALQPKLKRLVALKMVLNAGHAGPQELARFRSEAEAVARLQHPNIVHVYEIGEHEGRPFFSLEFVDGGSLAQRIAGKPQPTRQAAALVETLAQAVDYAHRQGIVHRDLKPANVLLMAHGMPKITDFGLAKRLEQDSSQTKTGAVLGTPSYIAPEQAAGKKDVGPPADIYALGAILYEMLTGRPPFRGESAIDTMMQVMNSEVLPPSRLQPKVPPDLETICLKCLRKEPAKRYGSALALAADLRRFLQGESIEARPAGPMERGWRWCRRRPLAAALILAVVFTGLAGVLGVTAMWLRADKNWKLALKEEQEADCLRRQADEQHQEADKQRKRAEENLRQARGAVNKFFTTVSASALLNQPGLQPLRKQLLDEALRYYQDFLKRQNGTDPAVKKDLAETYLYIGKITHEIGSETEAMKAVQKSRQLCEELLRTSPADADLGQTFILSLVLIGRLENRLGRLDDARQSYQRAEEFLNRLLAARPAAAQAATLHDDLILVYSEVGRLHQSAGRTDDAVRAFEKQRKLLEASPPTIEQRFQLTYCYRDLAMGYDQVGRFKEAQELIGKALPQAEQLAKEQPKYYQCLLLLATVYQLHGLYIRKAGNPSGALVPLQRGQAIANQLYRENPRSTSFRYTLANCELTLGEVLRDLKRFAEAIAALSRARILLTELCRENPAVIRYQPSLARTLLNLGQTQFDVGQISAAQKNIQQALNLWNQLVQSYPANATYRRSRDDAAAVMKTISSKR